MSNNLRQALKMEAVGQLAGRDFAAISIIFWASSTGIVRFFWEIREFDEVTRRRLGEILHAGQRATFSLNARQLLAFSRKQMLQPKASAQPEPCL